MKISVVIPSLGGLNLIKLLKSLELSFLLPDEVICILPKNFFFSYPYSGKFNLKIVHSNYKNQVIQRIIGLKHVKNDIILQLDDDVLVNKYTILHLYNALLKRNLKKTIVGPVFFTKNNKLHYDYKDENFFSEFIKFIFCAAPFGKNKLGKITSLGIAFNIDYNKKINLYFTEWLPGGCILYHRKNSILKFPFKYQNNKSYCEDIVHSFLRTQRNLRHYVVRESKIMTSKINYSDLNFCEIINEFKIRNNLLKYTKGNSLRFYIWCLFEIFNRIFKKFNPLR